MKNFISKALIGSLAISTCFSLGACTTVNRALGVDKNPPDEFKVVTQSPLIVPPDFNLRPPVEGASSPDNINPSSDARKAIFGIDTGSSASLGEKMLVAKAGATETDSQIRAKLDKENANIAHKSESFVDKVLDFKKDKEDGAKDTALDAQKEAKNLENKGVDVQKSKLDATKLPGL